MRAPLTRIGGADYRDFTLEVEQYLSTDFPGLQTVLSLMRAGNATYLRTAAGQMLRVALRPQQEIAYQPASYLALRMVKLQLVEMPNAYAPSLVFGTTRGLLTQVGGSV